MMLAGPTVAAVEVKRGGQSWDMSKGTITQFADGLCVCVCWGGGVVLKRREESRKIPKLFARDVVSG